MNQESLQGMVRARPQNLNWVQIMSKQGSLKVIYLYDPYLNPKSNKQNTFKANYIYEITKNLTLIFNDIKNSFQRNK